MEVQRVLACVDRSAYADHVAKYGAWAACRMAAPLELLHVITRDNAPGSSGDRSGAIGLGAQEKLLDQLSADDEARARDARESGRLFLNRLREHATAAGAPSVDVRQRFGELAETLAEQQVVTCLFVVGRRGEAAGETHRDLGRNVERIVRSLSRPVLIVTPGFDEPKRAMVLLDGGAAAKRTAEIVASSPLLAGLPILLFLTGNPGSAALRQANAAVGLLKASGIEVSLGIRSGDPETQIAAVMREEATDLLVLQAKGPKRTLGFLSRLRTTELLRATGRPTLLLST